MGRRAAPPTLAGALAVTVLALETGALASGLATAVLVAVLARGAMTIEALDRETRKLRTSETRLEEAHRIAGLGHWEWDVRRDRLRASDHLMRLAGLDPEAGELNYGTYLGLVHAKDRRRVQEAVEAALEQRMALDYRTRIVRPDGRTIVLHVRGATPAREAPDVCLVGTAQDVTALEETERGLLQAREFLRGVMHSLGEAVYTVDADGRLTYMNPAAEELLGRAERDMLGRDPHPLLHPGERDPAACPLAGLARLGAPVRVGDSIVARGDGAGLPVAYSASPLATGGGVAAFRDISERKAVERRLRRERDTFAAVARARAALDQDRLVAYSQPIVDVRDRTVVGEELLLRMVDEHGAVVPAGAFVPAAEELGLVRELDVWMIGAAAGLAAAGRRVSVNLSATSVGDSRVLRAIERAVGSAGADPGRLTFELTETALTSDLAHATEFARRISALGCALMLDDFGTGYGTFTYLKHLPISHLKIDREFVQGVLEEHSNRHVIRAVVALAHDFGLQTVAEGVEDAATFDAVRALGVDLAQGFMFGRPQPAIEQSRR